MTRSLRGLRKSAVKHQKGDQVEQLRVTDPDIMNLENVGDLALQILDALPVQIFIKEAKITPGFGRRYRYLNRKALEKLNWTFSEAITRGDQHAVPDAIEWQRMADKEGQVIQSQDRQHEQFKWTTPSGAWLFNSADGIAVVSSGGDCVGFCAIAEDIEFQGAANIYGPMLAVFKHEFQNAANTLTLWEALQDLKQVSSVLDRVAASSDSTPLIRSEIQASKDSLLRVDWDIQRAYAELQATKEIASAMMEAFSDTGSRTSSTALDLLIKLQEILGRLPAILTVTNSLGDTSQLKVTAAKTCLAALLEMGRNAYKHTKPPLSVEYRPEIRLDVSMESNRLLRWTISNRGTSPGPGPQISDLGASKDIRLGGLVLMSLLRFGLGVEKEDVGRLFVYPKFAENGWINVVLLTPIGD